MRTILELPLILLNMDLFILFSILLEVSIYFWIFIFFCSTFNKAIKIQQKLNWSFWEKGGYGNKEGALPLDPEILCGYFGIPIFKVGKLQQAFLWPLVTPWSIEGSWWLTVLGADQIRRSSQDSSTLVPLRKHAHQENLGSLAEWYVCISQSWSASWQRNSAYH